jgi:hypothetical protein
MTTLNGNLSRGAIMPKPNFAKRAGLTIGGAIVFLVCTFVVWVFAHEGDQSVVHACVNPASGEVKIVGPNDGCRPGWIAEHWAKGGPAEPDTVYYAEQTATVTTSGLSNWEDLTGASVAFATAANATVDLLANGAVTAVEGDSPWVRCALRFVVDDMWTGNPAFEEFGDMVVSPALNETGPAEWSSFTLTRRLQIGPGEHTVRTQIARARTQADLNSNCEVDGPGYSGVRLFVTVR